jgi:hypothetical protein
VLAALRPRIAVPRQARGTSAAAIPCMSLSGRSAATCPQAMDPADGNSATTVKTPVRDASQERRGLRARAETALQTKAGAPPGKALWPTSIDLRVPRRQPAGHSRALAGQLTIRGYQRAVFTAEGTLNCEDWGLTYSQLFNDGGQLGSEEVRFEIDLEAVLQA